MPQNSVIRRARISGNSAKREFRRRRREAIAGTIAAGLVLIAADPAAAATSVRPLVSATESGKVLTLGSGTYTFSDFGADNAGLDLTGTGGISGAGAGRSVIQMTAKSSTKASSVPTASGTSNPLTLMRATGTPTLSGFTLQGTSQGHLYNGLKIASATNATVSNVTVATIPGAGYNPPQETFAINDQSSKGSSYSNVTVDGSGVGATGFAANSSSNVTIKNSTFTNNPYSAGVALWQTSTATLTNVSSTSNRTGLNFERCSGTITVTSPTIQNDSNQDLYVGSDQASVKIKIVDPTYSGHLRIRVPATYRGVANMQKKSDITVVVNGVDKTASVVTWL